MSNGKQAIMKGLEELRKRGVFKAAWDFATANKEIIDGQVYVNRSIKRAILVFVFLFWILIYTLSLFGHADAIKLITPINWTLGTAIAAYAGTKILHSGALK